MGLYKNWNEVAPANGGNASLPAGAYVIRITKATDDPIKELVEFTYDIAEGEHAGHYNDEWGMNNTWAHKFSRWYGDSSEGSFRTFLDTVEQSNPGVFSIEAWQTGGCAPSGFVGMVVGAIMRKRIYVPTSGKNAGTVQEGIEVGRIIPAADVRNGNWKPMPPRDTRKGAATMSQPQTPPQPAQSRFAQPQQPIDVDYANSIVPPFGN